MAKAAAKETSLPVVVSLVFFVLATIGLGLLPVYWFFWKNARNPEYDSARRWLTVTLAGMCWYMFLVGHIVNNVRGFGS